MSEKQNLLRDTSLHVDLYSCNPQLIKSENKLREFIQKLSKMMPERKFGDCAVIYLGAEDYLKGYSLVQLFQNSVLTGKFVDEYRQAQIEIISYAPFNVQKIIEFCQKFFQAGQCKYKMMSE